MTITELLPKLTEEERKYLEQNAKSQKDFYDYFVTKGLTDSFENFSDFVKMMEKFSDAELGDDDLEKIAGGGESDGELDEHTAYVVKTCEELMSHFPGYYPPGALS